MFDYLQVTRPELTIGVMNIVLRTGYSMDLINLISKSNEHGSKYEVWSPYALQQTRFAM